MRIYFSDIERPKAAAKFLARLSSEVTLAGAHEALARASGYRDWHELAGSFQIAQPAPTGFSIPVITQLVLSLAVALRLDCGDVQYAIAKARVVGSRRWSLADQLELYMAAIRGGFLGETGRGSPERS